MRIRSISAVLAFPAVAVAQAAWYSPTLLSNPPRRHTHELATEPVSGNVLLFGGVQQPPNVQLNDTWEWNGQTWLQMQPSVSPSVRETYAVAPDGQGGVLLFGGYSYTTGLMGDTWRYAQGQWQPLQPSNSPFARRGQHMVHTTQGILLFGGSDSSSTAFYSDTWEWTGTTWVQRFPTSSPSPRRGQGMAYDPVRNRVVLFGGLTTGLAVLGDTWEWDGSNWIRMLPATSPAARGDPPMAHEPTIQKSVLYDGNGFHDCWTWDGVNWTSVTLSPNNPGPRYGSPIAYSPQSGGLVLFGGVTSAGEVGDTWIAYPAVPATFSAFGSGCAGSAGIPSLAAASGSLPRVGQGFSMSLSNLPAIATVAIGNVGFSTTFNNSPRGNYALPADLGSIGMPGCTQYVDDEATFFLLALNGQVTWTINVPAVTQLAGVTFHVQGAVFDLPANALGVTVTNAGTGQVGF